MTVQYLIDSENVGDFWIPLLELPASETELIVFYTRNSPHMSYDSLIRLKESDRTVTFIKCYEGTNALDFQLVSELGYRISKDEGGRFVIVTNDTGFDAAVKYWRRRKISVKRITGKECKNLERRLREDLSVGMPSVRSASVRVYTEQEHDAEQDVQDDAIHAQEAQDQDRRPSGPNLRDAERAAQPDPDDGFPEADSDYMADADMDDPDADDADLFASDTDSDDFEEDAYEAEEDDLQDGDDYDIDSGVSDDADDLNGLEDAFDTEQDAFSEEDPEADEIAADEDDRVQDDGFSPEKTEEDLLSKDTSAEEDSLQEDDAQDTDAQNPVKDFESAAEIAAVSETETAGEPVRDDHVQEENAQAVTEETDADFAAAESVREPAAAAAIEMPLSETVAAGDIADDSSLREQELDPSWFGTGDDTDALDEDAGAEASHRSRSRRSRSRRSKSTARKQEQMPAAAEKTEPAAAEDGMPNREASGKAGDNTGSGREMIAGPDLPPGDEEIARIVACIGADNLAELHNQLATIYGDQGKDIYLSIKNNSRTLPVLKPDLKKKFEYYCEIIFARSDYAGEYPSDISEYLLNVREKLNNLNSLRYALQKHYGKEKGRRFYFLLKPFAKTMYQM